jgi:hypothetical protein
MDTEAIDNDLAARLKRLEASATPAVSFGYDALIDRHAAKQVRAGRRLKVARGTASVLIVALVAASVWRFDQPLDGEAVVNEPVAEENSQASQPRIVRADSYLAVAALEDHIATLDDALNVARLRGGSADETFDAGVFVSHERGCRGPDHDCCADSR